MAKILGTVKVAEAPKAPGRRARRAPLYPARVRAELILEAIKANGVAIKAGDPEGKPFAFGSIKEALAAGKTRREAAEAYGMSLKEAATTGASHEVDYGAGYQVVPTALFMPVDGGFAALLAIEPKSVKAKGAIPADKLVEWFELTPKARRESAKYFGR